MMPDVDKIMKWENGEMSYQEEIDFFQGLVDSGVVWQLQGCYGRRAMDLICSGAVKAVKQEKRRE